MVITPTTDLAPFAGRRVLIGSVRYARLEDIRHYTAASNEALRDGFGGSMVEDAHGNCRGGNTAFWFQYGTTIEIDET